MNKLPRLLLCGLVLLSVTACTFVPKTGMRERRWLKNTIGSDLVYIEGDVKAYRSSGSYYYFKGGRLAVVTPNLLSADKITAGQ
jgi:hypothetical protein